MADSTIIATWSEENDTVRMASCLGFSSLLVSFDGANVELFGQDDEPGQQSSGSKTFTRLLSNLVKVLLWTTLNSFAALQDLHPAEYASWMISLWHTLQVVRFVGTTGHGCAVLAFTMVGLV